MPYWGIVCLIGELYALLGNCMPYWALTERLLSLAYLHWVPPCSDILCALKCGHTAVRVHGSSSVQPHLPVLDPHGGCG